MAKKKRSWNTDRLLSLTAMIVSVTTLMIFIYQTNLLRKQNYISVLPYLDISTSSNLADSVFTLTILNHGVGPAIIESLTITYQGKSYDVADYDNYLLDALQTIAPELDSLRYLSTATVDRGMAIPANTRYQVFRTTGDSADYELITRTLQRLLAEGLDYDLVYRSILNERWRLQDGADGPQELD